MATATDTIGEALVHSNLLQPAELERALLVNDHNGDGIGPLLVRLVNLLINRAMSLRASDIHIEPFENRLKVRYRIDGVLQEGEAPPVHSAAAVISRIKIMAKLNIAERRLPQDGRIRVKAQGKPIDLRVSTVPIISGVHVRATPEEVEAVQVFTRMLVNDYGYPKELIQTRPQWRVKARPSESTGHEVR